MLAFLDDCMEIDDVFKHPAFMFLSSPHGFKPPDEVTTLGSIFAGVVNNMQPVGAVEDMFFRGLLCLAATGHGLQKRSLQTAFRRPEAPVVISPKRPRVERQLLQTSVCVVPSRVLHIRGLPSEVTETDIAKLAMPFGPIANFVLTKKTGQTLIEMANEDISTKMLEYYQLYPPRLKGGSESAILQYSKYPTLEITGISRPVSEAIATANEHFLHFITEHPTPPRVLRVFLDSAPQNHLNYMDYFKIFYRYGAILRIVVFKMSGRSQAFVEFHSPISAHVALVVLNGHTLPVYASKLKIEFSRQTSLEIRQDDNTSRDFITKPLTATEEEDLIQSLPPI